MNKMPVLFVGHGSPMNALDAENPFNQGFRRIVQKFAKPKAILMISAHWYGNRLQVTSGERPEMIYDFYGFPAALSQVQYPAPGSPELAGQMRSLLQPANVETNPERGLDHGAWAVLKHLYPEVDIPVVQLGLNLMQPAQWHFDLAKKLAPLREQGVLVAGSGNIVHNLRAMRREPAALVDAKLSNGEYLVSGKNVAAFTNAEEEATGGAKIVPFLLETALVEHGAKHHAAPNWAENVVVDGRLITGQNPASAKGVGVALAKALG